LEAHLGLAKSQSAFVLGCVFGIKTLTGFSQHTRKSDVMATSCFFFFISWVSQDRALAEKSMNICFLYGIHSILLQHATYVDG